MIEAQAEPSIPVFMTAMNKMSKNKLTILLTNTAFMTNCGLPSVLIKFVMVMKRSVKTEPSNMMRK